MNTNDEPQGKSNGSGGQTPPTAQYSVKYKVVKPFKYAGRMLRPGQDFYPSDGKWDKQLIEGLGGYVKRDESAMPARGRRR